MLSLIKRYRELIVVGVLLLYPLGRFLASSRSERDPNFIDRFVLALSTPVQSAITWTIDGAADTWTNYAWLRGVREQNAALTAENAKLREQLNGLVETRAENERLKKALTFAEGAAGTEIPARVIGVGPTSNALTLRINRGEDDGVKKGMPVATHEGVVGQIIRATGSSADVLLLTDSNSFMGVRNQRSRARAVAKGRGDREVTIDFQFALRTDDLEEGDAIVTSGTDGVFPPGLMVGRLTAIQRKTTGPLAFAQVIPAVDVNRIEEVFVLSAAGLAQGGGAVLPFVVQPAKAEEKKP